MDNHKMQTCKENKLVVHGIDAKDELHFEWSNTWNTKYKRN